MENNILIDGKYKILKTLGQGGMGKVYLAENLKLGTLWAIKEISKKSEARIDLLVEPNILKKLNHPALPRIFDITENEDNIYIIVDYVEGVSLDKELAKVGKFHERTVIEFAKQICDVLNYLHNFKPNPIIYRDMKPSNIILTGEGTIKLIDFGIAREYKKESGSDTVYIGTRGYAAPEQYGIGQSDATTDIFSLGVTLYHLITGKNPNEAPYEIKPVRYFEKSLSEDIEQIILKCTKSDPEDRYQSVQELLADLNNIGVNEGPEKLASQKSGSGKNIKFVNFKKLVFTVWDNAEFACELAYIAAKLSKFKVLLVNLDFISPKIDIYMDIKEELNQLVTDKVKKMGFEAVMDALTKKTLDYDAFEGACLKRHELDNLHILTASHNIENYGRYNDNDISGLIESAYQYYDVTILVCNKSVMDSAALVSLSKSDYNIIAIPANFDVIREFRTYLHYLKDKHNIPTEKFKFAAFEYKKDVNYPLSYLKNIVSDDSYIGYVSYSPDREKCRNLNSPYAKLAFMRNLNEYIDILSKFNIVPARNLRTKFSDWLKNRFHRVEKEEVCGQV